MAETAIIVPCRLESTRFPRKLLHPIRGKPLLRWVAERIAREAPEFPLWFAVDHDLLRECVEAAGFRALMTSGAHQSGTDRIAEANRTVRADFVINVQADEPLVSGGQIRALAKLIQGAAPMATLATPFQRVVDFYNANQVKVVLRQDGRALFFSRSRLPFSRPAISRSLMAARIRRRVPVRRLSPARMASFSASASCSRSMFHLVNRLTPQGCRPP